MINLNLNFNDAYIDRDYMYFSSRDFNGLFRLKKREEYAEWIGQFPQEAPWHKNLHCKIVEHNRTIFFTPYSGHGIHMYNLEKKEFKFFPLQNEKIVSFSNAINVNGKIYLIPRNIHTPFMVYDAENECIYRDDSFWRYVGKACMLSEKLFIGGFGAALAGKSIYITVVGLDAVICYDIDSHNIHLKKTNFYPRSIQYIDGAFYFTLLNSYKTVIYDVKKDEAKEIIPISGVTSECPFSSVLRYRDKMFFMPGGCHAEVMEIDFDDKNIEVKSFSLVEAAKPVPFAGLYKSYLQKDAFVLFLPKAGNGIIIFDLDQKGVKMYKVKCGLPYAEQCYGLYRCGGLEQENRDLEIYMKLLSKDFENQAKERTNINTGEKIMKVCKGESNV